MKFKQSLGFCLIALFALAGCKKSSNSKPAVKTDVYVSGNRFESVNATAPEATLWKNGIASQLTGLPNNSYATTTAITTNGRDIYVAGYTSTSGTDVNTTAVYWKNGAITKLDPGSSAPALTIGIAVSGTDVYVAGDVILADPNAAYWKNGVVTNLTNPGLYFASSAQEIAASGTDVYVCGSIVKNTGEAVAVYWKNGVLHEITDGSKSALATSIAVQNNNVYITYSELHQIGFGDYVIAFYWKNGVVTQLTNDQLFSMPGSITLNGSDVYITGYLGTASSLAVTAFWKNNVLQEFPGTGKFGSKNVIAVSGNDVYLTGNANEGAKYWKNGVAVLLGDQFSNANGIAVVH